MKTFRFQGLLSKNSKGDIRGAMSPVLGASAFAKEMNIKISGLARVHNDWDNGATYDHWIIKRIHSNCSVYHLVCDMGINYIPIAIWISDENEVTVTPIYKKEIKNRKYHASSVECRGSVPILTLTDNELLAMFKQAHESDEFDIKDYDG